MIRLLTFQHAVSVPMMMLLVTLAALGAAYFLIRAATLMLRRRAVKRPAYLLALAVAPTMIAMLLALGIVLPAFLRFEPPHEGERAGLVLVLLAVMGAWHATRLIARAARMLIVSRAFTKQWMASASALEPSRWGLPAFAIDAGFPVVAVAGLFRPRLLVDRSVLSACSAQELDAIAAHERAHVLYRDNLRRLLIGACEGPASDAAVAWREAAELAADAHAADSPRRAVDLASALLKLARLTPRRLLEATALSTVHDGGNLEARVHQLLAIEAGHTRDVSSRHPWLAALSAFALAATLGWNRLLSSVHELIEELVVYLP